MQILLFHGYLQRVSLGYRRILNVGIPSFGCFKTVFAPSRSPIINERTSGLIIGISQQLTIGTASFLSLFRFFIHNRLCIGKHTGKYATHINRSVVIIYIIGRIGIQNITVFGTGHIMALIKRFMQNHSGYHRRRLGQIFISNNKNAQWTITVSGGQASIQNNAYKSRTIQYNASSPRFACYTSGQQPVTLYVNTTSGSSIKEVVATEDSLVDVYTINGQLVRQNVQASQALNGLKKGMYVIKGNKVLVK